MSILNVSSNMELFMLKNKNNKQNNDIFLYEMAIQESVSYKKNEHEMVENEANMFIAEKKRSRNFYCYSCYQYKPRSTKARFKICKHVSCYHCLRKALQIEYWATKKNEWTNYRARCPFCKIELDWNLMKPHIALSPEAKLIPLMSLYSDFDRKDEALKVIKAFFPNGVPPSFICEDEIDMSLRPSVAQVLFGFEDYKDNKFNKKISAFINKSQNCSVSQFTTCVDANNDKHFFKGEIDNPYQKNVVEMNKYRDVFYCWRNELMNENHVSHITSDCSTVGSPNINKTIKHHGKDVVSKSISTVDSWSGSNSEFSDD